MWVATRRWRRPAEAEAAVAAASPAPAPGRAFRATPTSLYWRQAGMVALAAAWMVLLRDIYIKYRARHMAEAAKSPGDDVGGMAAVDESVPVGLDMGGLNCRIAAPLISGGEIYSVRVLENAAGRFATPAFVALRDGEQNLGEALTGQAAKTLALSSPGTAAFGLTRLIGRPSSILPEEVELLSQAGVTVLSRGAVSLSGQAFDPVDLIGLLVRDVRQSAAAQFDEPIFSGVAAVPVHFVEAQRVALSRACEAGGLGLLGLLDEPLAAARAYEHARRAAADSAPPPSTTLLVYDGGLTPRASIIERATSDDRDDSWTVVAHASAAPLSSLFLDDLLARRIADQFAEETGIQLLDDPLSRARFLEAIEQARVDLSQSLLAKIHLPYISADRNGPRHLSHDLTRAQLEHAADDFLNDQVALCREVMRRAGDRPIHEIIFCGGLSRMPKLVSRIQSAVRAPATAVPGMPAPEDVMATGCAIEAARLVASKAEQAGQ